MVAVGFAWFAVWLQWSPNDTVALAGAALSAVHLGLPAHLLLAFPSGTVSGRVARGIVASAYVDAIPVRILLAASLGAGRLAQLMLPTVRPRS